MLRGTALFLVIAFAVSSCVSTKGIVDQSQAKNKTPYHFVWHGTIPDMRKALKRMALDNGFTIAGDEPGAGALATGRKVLDEDESINVNGIAFMFGMNIKKQEGRILFFYEAVDSSQIDVSMKCVISAQVSFADNAFRTSERDIAEDICPRGHPFPMKYRNALLADARFELKE